MMLRFYFFFLGLLSVSAGLSLTYSALLAVYVHAPDCSLLLVHLHLVVVLAVSEINWIGLKPANTGLYSVWHVAASTSTD